MLFCVAMFCFLGEGYVVVVILQCCCYVCLFRLCVMVVFVGVCVRLFVLCVFVMFVMCMFVLCVCLLCSCFVFVCL